MFTKFLLPSRAAKIGWLLAIPSLVLMFAHIQFGFTLDFLDFQSNHSGFFEDGFLWDLPSNNFTDEIGTVVLLIGLLLVALAKHPQEDERISQMRLESLLWAILVNTLLIIICVIVFYGTVFLQIMAWNIATPLMLFIARFHFTLLMEKRKMMQP